MITGYSDLGFDSRVNQKKMLATKKIDGRDYVVIGTFPDELSAQQRKREILQKSNSLLHHKQLLGGDWNPEFDILVKKLLWISDAVYLNGYAIYMNGYINLFILTYFDVHEADFNVKLLA